MKLHLPYPLRRALLACLAATALPAASIPTTIASASGIAAVFLAANARVQAEWPSDGEFQGKTETAVAGFTFSESGTLTYSSDIDQDGVVTLQGGSDEGSAINVKLTGDVNYASKLSLQGHIGDLLITGGSFTFDGGWEFGADASVRDIYVKDASLSIWSDVNLGSANLHLGGKADANADGGALQVLDGTTTVTLSGSLVIESDTLISVLGSADWGDGVFKLTGELTTGDAGTSHNLLLGSNSDNQGGAHVEFLGGGTLDGTLGFTNKNGSAPYLVLGKGKTLSVHGLNSSAGGYIIGGGEGSGYAELVLNGTDTYTFDGDLGTSNDADGRPTDNSDGIWTNNPWDAASFLDLTVNMQEGGKQQLRGHNHLHSLTVTGGTLEQGASTAGVTQVDGNVTISGTGFYDPGRGNCWLVVNGDLTVSNLTMEDAGRKNKYGICLDGGRHVRVRGNFYGEGDKLALYGADTQLILEKGGELDAALRHGWGAGLTLGGDLVVKDLEVDGDGATTVQRLASDDAPDHVFLLKAAGDNESLTVSEYTSKMTYDITYTDETVSYGVWAGEGKKLTLTGSGDWNLAQCFKVAGEGGTLEVGSEAQKVNMKLTQQNTGNGTLIVDNVHLIVHGSASVADFGLMRIYGGGSLTADAIEKGGHSGTIILGDASNGSGTLNVEGITKVYALGVYGEDSVATLRGDLSFWGALSNGSALDVDGGQVTVGGSFYADGAGQAKGTVRVHNGGQFTVAGTSALFQTLNVDGGTVTVTHRLGLGTGASSSGSLSITGGGSVTAESILHTGHYPDDNTQEGYTAPRTEYAAAINVGDADSTGTLTLTGSGDNVIKALTLNVRGSGSSVTVSNGSARFKNLSVDGGSVTVQNFLGIGDEVSGVGSFSITNGGSVTAGYIRCANTTGHAPTMNVGSADSSGTLTLNGTGADSGNVLQAMNLNVQGAGSTVSVTGATNVLYDMSVSGATVTLHGGLTSSGTVTVSGGKLELGGSVSVTTLRLEGGVLSLGTETAALGSSLEVSLSLKNGAKFSVGTAGASGQTITLNIAVDDVDVSKFVDGKYHIWETEGTQDDFTVSLSQDLTIGRGTLTYNSGTGDLELSEGQQTLTWDASSGDLTWQSGEGGTSQWVNSDEAKTEDTYKKFYDGDNVIFEGEGSKNVTLEGSVRAWNMDVKNAGWVFDIGGGETLAVSGTLTLEDGADVKFQGDGTLQVADGHLTQGTVTLTNGDASHYSGTTFWNEGEEAGKVVLDFGGEVTLNADNNLFAALFAGGDANVQRDADHVGIGQVEVASGTKLVLGQGVQTSTTLARTVVVQDGASIVVDAGSQNPFESQLGADIPIGTLVLNGTGTDGEGALVDQNGGGERRVNWNVELGSDALIQNKSSWFNFGAPSGTSGKFKLNGHELTLKKSGSQHFYISYGYGAEGKGTIHLTEGTGLIFKDEEGRDFADYLLYLETNSVVTVQDTEDLHIAGLYGVGSVRSSDADNRTLYLAGNAPGDDEKAHDYYDANAGYTFSGNISPDGGYFNIYKTGTAIQTVEGNATLQALNVSGGTLNVTGELGVVDDGGTPGVIVTGGALKAGSIHGIGGHADVVAVGSSSTAGALEVGTTGVSAGDILKARALFAQGGSTVNIHGDVNLYATIAAGTWGDLTIGADFGGTAVGVTGSGTSVTIDGSLHGDGTGLGSDIYVYDGGNLTVKGDLNEGVSAGVWVKGASSKLSVGGTYTTAQVLATDGGWVDVTGNLVMSQNVGGTFYGNFSVRGANSKMTVGGDVTVSRFRDSVGDVFNITEGGVVDIEGDFLLNHGAAESGSTTLTVDGTSSSLSVGGDFVFGSNSQVSAEGGTLTVSDGGALTVEGSLAGSGGKDTTFFGRGHAAALVVGNSGDEEKGDSSVEVGTAGDEDEELLQVRQLTVYKNGTLTVHGNLSASWQDSVTNLIEGAVSVANDMVSKGSVNLDGEDASLTVNGVYKGAANSTAKGGAIQLTAGAHADLLGGLYSTHVTIRDDATVLTVGGTVNVNEFTGESGTVKLAEEGANFLVNVTDGNELNMTFDAAGQTLTKTGANILTLNKYKGTSSETGAGSLVVEEGGLIIGGVANKEGGETYLAQEVRVNTGSTGGGSGSQTAYFRVGDAVEGATTYTVGTVHFEGNMAPAGNEVTANGEVSVRGDDKLVIEELDLTTSNGSLSAAEGATGSITVNSFTAGGDTHGLRVGWRDRTVNVTLGDGSGDDLLFAGGLYLANDSIVTLAENASIGWLGGNATASLTANWSDVGGTIKASEATKELTLTSTTEHIGSGYTIESGVTLKLGEGAKQTFTGSELKGNIELDQTNSVLAFKANGENANTVTGQLSGSGTLQVQGGSNGTALKWNGTTSSYTGTLSFDGTPGGILELQKGLEVGNLETQVSGTINGSGQTLKLNYTGSGGSAGAAQAQKLTLGSGVTLEKTGVGTFTLNYVDGQGGVKVSGGTLIVNGEGWGVDEVEVATNGTLSAANSDEVGGTVKLNGGTLALRGGQDKFEKVNVADGGGAITTGSVNGDLIIGELTGSGSFTIGAETTGERNKRVVVNKLNDYSGTITGTLNIDGSIEGASSGTVGKLVVADDGGDTGHQLRMNGTSDFTATTLELRGTLHMVRGNTGNLSVTNLTLGPKASLKYEGSDLTKDNLIALEIADIQTALGSLSGAKLRLDVGEVDLAPRNNGFCLGITGEGESTGDADELYHDLFDAWDTNASGDFTLYWGEGEGEDANTLYIRMEFIADADTEYDPNWGIVRNKENLHGPSKLKMDEYVKAYIGEGGEDGVLGQLLTKADSEEAKFFTDAVLSLAGKGTTEGVTVPENTFTENNGRITAIRLTKGDTEDTLLSVVGGSVFRDSDSPELEIRNSFIVLKVDDENEANASYHLLVGGSSCVSGTGGGTGDEGGFVGFSGNTHLQVQGGTVDYLVGGNHVTNTFFGFEGDTFISVFDNNGGEIESNVRGGIAGGSVLTWSDDAGTTHRDFSGNTHIFIYTLLHTKSTTEEDGKIVLNPPTISDGTTEGGATGFAAVVGGNVWIDVPSDKVDTSLISPSFVGTTSIFVNLLDGGEADTPLDGDGLDDPGVFDKAIVGGNYTVPKDLGIGAQDRTSNFLGTAKAGEYDTHITIYAGEEHTFTGGINGASRRDSSGAGTTNFEGDTLVELYGGAYTNVVAGGMWFEAPWNGTSEHKGSFTGNSNVKIHGGKFFRIVGGNVSLESNEGSKDNFAGTSSVTIYGGTFGTINGEDALEQTQVPFVAGGSFYRSPDGTPEHTDTTEYLTELKIYGGTFNDVHLVGGDYVNSYKEGSDTETRGSTINGDTRVVIGWSEEEGNEEDAPPDGTTPPDITGVVVGGSYLTDEGTDGKSTITGSTNVVINDGLILAEAYGPGDGGTYHAHGRVAVVAGSMLIDNGDKPDDAGGHTIEIKGGTNLTINGGTIGGFVVGGSYTSDSMGTNTINLGGDINIDLNGGTIHGNVIGGHYSENTAYPDNFTLGNVNINVQGSEVRGVIFGGSFRRAETGTVDSEGHETHPQQGDITINLTSGSVAGGVYAAGNHLNTGEDAELHVHTEKTTVKVTGDIEFTQYHGVTVDGNTVDYRQFILSGGYQKNILAAHDIEDYSTVGYHEGEGDGYGTWEEGAALLHFSNEGDDDSFGNLAQFSTNLILQDFDAVEVDEGLRVDLSGSVMRVMHKVAGVDGDEENHDVFIKQGKGDLVLKGLSSWNAQKYNSATGRVGTEKAYEGLIAIEDGHLILNGTGSQSLLGGLRFNMGKDHLVATGLEGDAYLQAQGGLKFSLAGATKAEGGHQVELKLSGFNRTDGLAEGIYRLASGVDWGSLFGSSMPDDEAFSDAVLEYFNVVDQEDKTLSSFFKEGEATGLGIDIKKMFKFERGDGEDLVLRVYLWSQKDWVWSGENEDHIWDGSTRNFYRDDEVTIEGKDTAYFFEGAYTEGDVFVQNDITVDDIEVRSGSFNFVEHEGGGTLTVKGALKVGTAGDALGEGVTVADRDKITASAGIGLDGENILSIELNIGGQLVLNDVEALGDDTKIIMNGGTLAYGELTETQLALDGDALRNIQKVEDYTSNKNAVLRIQVGKSASDLTTDSITTRAEDEYAVHEELVASDSGDMETNAGIELGIRRGVIKSGRGVYEFEYTGKIEDENGGDSGSKSGKFDGTLRSREGRLEMVFSSTEESEVDIKANDVASTQSGRRLLLLSAEDEKAELQLIARNGAKVQVSRGMTGNGTIIIGEAAEPDVAGRYILATTEAELTAQNEGFTGTLDLRGDSAISDVIVKGDTATLGNENSTLRLAGRAIVLSDDITEDDATITVKEVQVAEGATNYLGGYDTSGKSDADKAITLNASVTGDGTLASAKGGFTHTIDGDMSNFNGTLIAGDSETGREDATSTWTLTDSGASLTQENLELEFGIAGTGSVKVDYGLENDKLGKVYLKGVIGSKEEGNNVVVLENAMEGTTLVIAGKNNTSTGKLVFSDNEIWLGDDGIEANWAGSSLSGDSGSFVLRNGTLDTALTEKDGVALKVDTAASEQGLVTVNVGGTEGSRFDEITINEGGRLRGVEGNITVGSDNTKVKLVFSKDSLGNVQGAGKASDYLIESTGDLVIKAVNPTAGDLGEGQYYDESDPSPSFVIDFSNEALLKIIMDHRNADIATYLRALSGGTISFEDDAKDALDQLMRTGKYSGLLQGCGFTLDAVGGDFILRGSSTDIYLVLSDENDPGAKQSDPRDVDTTEEAQRLADKKATLLDEGTTLTLQLGEDKAGADVTVNNLVGLSGSTVNATGEGTVTLNNAEANPDPMEDDKWLEGVVGQVKPKGQDTEFDGKLKGGSDVTYKKTGQGTLTVGDGTANGGLDIDGTLKLENGDLVVRGGDNGKLGVLEFAYGEDSTTKEGLVVDGGKLSVGDITESEGNPDDNRVTLKHGGVFEFNGGEDKKGTLDSTTFSGSGTLAVADGSQLTLGNNEGGQLKNGVGVALAGPDSVLDVGKGKNAVSELNGTGTLKSNGGADGRDSELTVSGGSFSGTLGKSDDADSAGTLAVEKNGNFTLKNAKSAEGTTVDDAWDVQLSDGSQLTADVSGSSGEGPLVLGDVDLGDGNMTVDFGDGPMQEGKLEANLNSAGSSGTLEFHSDGRVGNGVLDTGLDVSDGLTGSIDRHVKFTGAGNFLKDNNVYVYTDEEGHNNLMVQTSEAQQNKLERALPQANKNALAGAAMVWDSLKSKSQISSFFETLSDPNSDYKRLINAVVGQYDDNKVAELERTLTAVAGASISTIGPALVEDLHRQLKSIRNRTTTMAGEATYDGYDNLPLWHAWINGEGNYHKLDSDGYMPGYTLNNWGGTMGVDIDVTPQTTLGLAISAMYGDLKPDAADSASGHLDTTYLTAFLRAASGAWIHTFVVSGGLADVSLDRTVNYGTGSYRTKGDTDGYAVGAMYEVGYTKLTNKEGTMALQPVFNVEMRHASVKGYTETGSDAGLKVDDIRQDVVTFGAGARVQALVSENAFNRASILEARLLAKVDVGDRSGTAVNGIIGCATHKEVESAEVGAVGLEAGVGLSVPLGSQYGSLFLDGSVEWRRGWTSLNASAGYRINF